MKRKQMAVLFVVMMVVALLQGVVVHAEELSSVYVTDAEAAKIKLIPGESTGVKLPLKTRMDHVYEPQFTIEADENAPFEISNIKLYKERDYEANYMDITTDEITWLTFQITTKETAKKGKYPLKITFVDEYFDKEEDVPDPGFTVVAEIKKEKQPAELVISDFSYTGVLEPDKDAVLTFKIKNMGELTAVDTKMSVGYAGTSVIPNYTNYNIPVGTLGANEEKVVKVDVHILDTTMQNLIELPVELTYQDLDGTVFQGSNNNRLYLPIELPKVEEPEVEDGLLLVNGVSQSVEAPKAGQKVTVYFHLENTSSRDFTDVKVSPNYVSRVGFEPVNAEPYQYIGIIKAGERKEVAVTVIAGEDIASGMNTLDVTYSYVKWNKEKVQENVGLYVLNVVEKEEKKEEEQVVSKPKLMVTDFSTSLEEIKAGEQFDFTFSVMNTNEEVAAKNIKVTVTSSNFAVTSGSNSFFVSKIAPGEKVDLTINLKASAALTTGAYPISIAMEYEYEGMPTGAGYTDGVQVTEEKMITVKENLRVSVENISVGDWDIPIVNQATTLSMEVYNMGKSQLNNVYFTVEGDLIIANGSSYYYGNLSAGYPDYVEMSVIPNVSGTANGVLIIHMEDSNGDEVEYRKEFTCQVQEEQFYDWNEDMMGDMSGFIDEPVISEDVKEPILPIWAFLLIEAAVFVLAVVVARKVVLVRYRKKMQKQDEE